MRFFCPKGAVRAFLISLLLSPGIGVIGAAQAEDGPVDVKKAEWRGDRMQLRVEGEHAPARATVVVRDAVSDTELGRTSARSDGDWSLRMASPEPVPCRVRVAIGGEMGERKVEKCVVKKAEYRVWDRELRVEGEQAPRDALVSIVNFDTGELEASTAVDREGKWRWRERRVTQAVPCNLRVRIDTLTALIPVRDAPEDCNLGDGGPPPEPNQPPIADAGPDQNLTLPPGANSIAVTLNASGSSDSDGSIDSYNWSGSPNPADVQNPLVSLGVGSYSFTLVVTDNDGASASDSVRITVEPTPVSNQPPVADAGPDQTLTLAAGASSIAVTLDASGSSDPDGSIVSYTWSGMPNPANVQNPTVSLGEGTHSFTLEVTDDAGGSASDTVEITVNAAPPPVACNSPIAEHCTITFYQGPSTCVSCHEQEAAQMHGSVHYQQTGPTDFVTNIDGPAGERGYGAIGINTYCGTHENSPRFTCAGCHVGNGRFPSPTLPASEPARSEELANIDCLMCHQEVYKRFPDWTDPLGFETLEIVDADPLTGKPNPALPPIVRTGLEGIPVVDPVTLDFQFLPAGPPEDPYYALPADAPASFAPMPITAMEAAQNVHATTRKSCLNCHGGAGGGDGTKRGDMSSALVDPPLSVDMHMSSAGGGMVCADCHDAGGHRMRGRGLDLRPNDVAERFSCESCHSERPHGDWSGTGVGLRDNHAGRVACQSCHIPTYAKGVPTEVSRDWENPHFSAAACNGRGGWLPEEIKQGDLTPTYAWFDGTSEVYYLGETVMDNVPTKILGDGSEAYVLGMPNGDVASADAKLYPMKEHLSKLALNLETNILVPQSTFEFFRTGSFAAAVQAGLEQTAGMSPSDSYEVVQVHTYQTINHGVEVASNALECGACHSSYSGGPLRMDLQGELGYTLKGPESQVCTQCHGNKENKGFFKVHDIHVRGKRKDCSVCHSFSRPERGLSTSLN